MKNRKIGRYQLLERLGKGGMGEVYQGVQPSMGRTVAIKLTEHGYFSPEEALKVMAQVVDALIVAHQERCHPFLSHINRFWHGTPCQPSNHDHQWRDDWHPRLHKPLRKPRQLNPNLPRVVEKQ